MIESKDCSGRLVAHRQCPLRDFSRDCQNSRVYRFIKHSDRTILGRTLSVSRVPDDRVWYPSRLVPIASSQRDLRPREGISCHSLPTTPLYIPFLPAKGDQGCLAKSPKACTPGGIQPPSCLRPGRIAWRPSALPMHFHPPGSCFVKLDLRMACRRFVIPAGYILAKVPPYARNISLDELSAPRDDISRHTHRQTIS